MKKALAILLALAFAAQADARALVVRTNPISANSNTGIARTNEVSLGMLNNLGADYDVVNIMDAKEGATDALRRGAWYPNGIGTADSTVYDLVVVMADDKASYSGTVTNTGRETSVGGIGKFHTTNANAFAYFKPGMVVTGTGVTGSARVLSVDSLGQVLTVAGTVAGGGNITLSWRTPLRPDSLTLTYDATNGYRYPKVPILRLVQFMGTTGAVTTAGACSTGVGATSTYSAYEDSTVNVYDVKNPYRSWKARQYYATSATRDPRGWRPLLARVTTRKNEAGHGNGNYDFPDPACATCAFSTNPDTVTVWAVMNWGADGTPIRGDAKPNIYAMVSQVNGTNLIDPGTMLTAFAFADSVSGGGLFENSKKLPQRVGFHIDDGWKRGDSNGGSSYGGISFNDTTALVASIDSLASLAIPFVVGVELDSLDGVLVDTTQVADCSGGLVSIETARVGGWPSNIEVGDYITHGGATLDGGIQVASITNSTSLVPSAPSVVSGVLVLWKVKSGAVMDQRWWARAPLAHYTPHAHAGLVSSRHRAQNEASATEASKYLRILDIYGLSRYRIAFGSVDSLLAYGVPDYVNETAIDSASTYWLNKRAMFLCDSVFGKNRVDGLMMPAGDDWTNTNTKHTRFRRNSMGVDSVLAAILLSGGSGVRGNTGGNVVGNDDSTITNNYGFFPNWRRVRFAGAAGGAGMPSWAPAHLYGRSCDVVPTNGYPGSGVSSAANSSRASWSHNRASFGGEKFLLGLLAGHNSLGSDYNGTAASGASSGRETYIVASHVSDFGSNGGNGEATRPQFYTFKYITNAIRTANEYAGRKLVDIVYPDDVVVK